MPFRLHAFARRGPAHVAAAVAGALTTTLLLSAADMGPHTAPGTTITASSWAPRSSLRMIFPANPPPLGVQVPPVEQQRPPLSKEERALSGDMLEPYFSPLSTYRIQPWHKLGRKLEEMLEDYRAERADLVGQLRLTIETVRPAGPATRLATFSNLSIAQEPRLVELEKTAEIIRAKLAREMNWNRERRWQLGSDDREAQGTQTNVLEYLVVRAAPFYESDLTPAQRRLLREETSRMENQVFADPNSASRLFQFFSPDMMLVRFPTDLPKEIADEVALHAARKKELRKEIRDTLQRTDDDLGLWRGRTLRRLADEQEPQIKALEDLAEKIRQDLVNHDHSWRRSPPAALPPDVETLLSGYLSAKQRLEDEYLSTIEPILSTPPSASVRSNPVALNEWRNEYQQQLDQATADFERVHADEAEQLEDDAIALNAALAPHYHPKDLGRSAESNLNSFLHRRRVEATYYEYDIAAFEPGLSPRQRSLLFAASVASLNLPLPAPERPPIRAPETLIK